MEQKNEIILEVQDAVTLVHIHGDVTVFSEPFIAEANRKLSEQGASNIVLVFDSDAYINSGGIALLIQLLAQAKKGNQRVAITGLSNHFKKIFHMVGITKFAKVFDSQSEAILSFSS
ncbi:MAG: STAS domain-containing protein [Syntrophobacteraceae bacterium]